MIPPLIALLAEPDIRVRRRAYLALLQLGLEADVLAPAASALVYEFEPPDEGERWFMTRRGVREDLFDPVGRRRLFAAIRGADLDPAACVSFLVGLLDDPSEPVRDLAARVLRGPWFQAPSVWLSEAGADDPAARARAAFAAGSRASEGLPLLHDLIRDRDRAVRRAAAVSLVRLGAAALPALAVALEDDDAEARRQATWALGRPLGPEAVTVLIRALGHPRAEVRLAAARALQAVGGPARDALPALEHARGDPDEGVAGAAESSLAAIDSRSYGKSLRHWIAKLRDPRPGIRRNVTKILLYAPRTDALMAALVDLVRDPDSDVCGAARFTFEEGGVAANHPAFLGLLQDPEPRHRRNALGILGYWSRGQREDIVEQVVSMLDDPDESVRGEAVRILARRDADRGAETAYVLPLRAGLDELEHGDRHARARAAVALGDWDEEGIRPVLEALRDPDVLVRRGAAVALRRIGGPAVVASRVAARDADPDVRVTGAWLLGRHDPDAVPQLVGLIDDPSATVRAATIVALGSFGTRAEAALPALLDAASAPEDVVRRAALAALGEVGPSDPRAVAVLMAASRDADPWIRLAAAEGLGAADPADPAVVPALAGALGDAEWFVRGTAARSLGRIGPCACTALARLAAACSDPDDDVRRHARANLLLLLPEGDDEAGVKLVVSTLAAALDCPDWASRHWGLEGLARLAGIPPRPIPDSDGFYRHRASVERPPLRPRPEAAVALAAFFRDARPDVRRGAVSAFYHGPEAARAVLTELIAAYRADPDPDVRVACSVVFRTLGSGAAEAVPALIAALADPDDEVRFHAAHELTWVDPTVAAPLPVLVAGLGMPHRENRRMAAEALGRMGSLAAPAIPTLRDALRDEYENTRSAAARALEMIRGDPSVGGSPGHDAGGLA